MLLLALISTTIVTEVHTSTACKLYANQLLLCHHHSTSLLTGMSNVTSLSSDDYLTHSLFLKRTSIMSGNYTFSLIKSVQFKLTTLAYTSYNVRGEQTPPMHTLHLYVRTSELS